MNRALLLEDVGAALLVFAVLILVGPIVAGSLS